MTFSGAFNSVSFDFYVPVRFETDDLERQITAKSEPDNYVVYSIPKLVLKEVKIDFDDNVVDTFQKNLDHTLSLDLLKGTEIVQYQTDILSQESGFEKRSLVQEIPTTINNLQARNIVYQDDIEYLIALWLCVKGEGAIFNFDNGIETNRVRFMSKALSYTCQSNALVYSLAGIGVRELPLPIIVPTLNNTGGNGWSGVLTVATQWEGNDSVSSWISYLADTVFEQVDDYDYSITYTFSSSILNELNGRVRVDNQLLDVLVNGVSSSVSWDQFATWHEFSLTTSFVYGSNTITFLIRNYGVLGGMLNPTGIRVEWLGYS